jgi:hypothetical protein
VVYHEMFTWRIWLRKVHRSSCPFLFRKWLYGSQSKSKLFAEGGEEGGDDGGVEEGEEVEEANEFEEVVDEANDVEEAKEVEEVVEAKEVEEAQDATKGKEEEEGDEEEGEVGNCEGLVGVDTEGLGNSSRMSEKIRQRIIEKEKTSDRSSYMAPFVMPSSPHVSGAVSATFPSTCTVYENTC